MGFVNEKLEKGQRDAPNNDADYIWGGAGSDTIHGGGGDDILAGCTRDSDDYNEHNEYGSVDILMGGNGYDKYYAGKRDIIYDNDGLGEIYVIRDGAAKHLKGPIREEGWYKVGEHGEWYEFVGGVLLVFFDGWEGSVFDVSYDGNFSFSNAA